MIVHNDFSDIGRQASDLAHELSHALLLHPPGPVLDKFGCRNWDSVIEEEAKWLGGALLISEEAALLIARNGWTNEEAAVKYQVTVPMIRFRLHVLGAARRVRRSRRASSPHR